MYEWKKKCFGKNNDSSIIFQHYFFFKLTVRVDNVDRRAIFRAIIELWAESAESKSKWKMLWKWCAHRTRPINFLIKDSNRVTYDQLRLSVDLNFNGGDKKVAMAIGLFAKDFQHIRWRQCLGSSTFFSAVFSNSAETIQWTGKLHHRRLK